MHIFIRFVVLAAALAICGSVMATSFTYQGQLQDGSSPYNGSPSMTFTLFEDSGGPNQVGSAVSLPSVAVQNGLFQVELDFGDQPFEAGLWLEIAINGTPLSPRQPILAAPLALRALSSDGGAENVWTVTGANIYYNAGRVGIGTASPNVPLHVRGDGSNALFRVQNSSGGSRFLVAENGGATVGTFDDSPPPGGLKVHGVVQADDNVTVNGNLAINANASSDLSYIRFRADSGTTGVPRIYHRNSDNQIHFVGMDKVTVFGTARADVIEVAGADLAEEFAFSEPVTPGALVAIDPERPGQLRLADSPYDPMVAGIVAGANDFSTGMVLGQGSGNENAAPVALSGRVFAQATGVREIRPGDFLTTSDLPGHAQAATDRERRAGAVIGKAMTGLPEGEIGLVLVLVNLQ